MSLFGFGGQHSPHLGCVTVAHLLSDLKESESESHSVVSNSWRSHGLFSPWNSPGQNIGVGSFPFSRGSSQSRDLTAVSFDGTQNKRRLCHRSGLLCKLLCHLGHVTQDI